MKESNSPRQESFPVAFCGVPCWNKFIAKDAPVSDQRLTEWM